MRYCLLRRKFKPPFLLPGGSFLGGAALTSIISYLPFAGRFFLGEEQPLFH